jgi:hypothetical protein
LASAELPACQQSQDLPSLWLGYRLEHLHSPNLSTALYKRQVKPSSHDDQLLVAPLYKVLLKLSYQTVCAGRSAGEDGQR